MKRLIIVFFVVLNITFLLSCEKEADQTAYKATIFKNTVLYELAKAIEINDYSKFNTLLKNITIEDIQNKENTFGFTILHWTIYRNDLTYSRELLKFGCNPNYITKDGSNCILEAATQGNLEAIKLLIEFGVNVKSISIDTLNGNFEYKVPIVEASHSNLNVVKALVEAGANPRFEIIQASTRICPLRSALLNRNIDIVNYLIFECKVDFKNYLSITSDNDTLYVSHYLRNLLFDLNSLEYKKKMKLVRFLSENNIDYFSTDIPKHYYANYDSLYLSKY